MSDDTTLRQQLVNVLTVQQACMSFESAVKDFPEAHINTKPQHVEYSFWQLVEHIRICQWDILDYIRNPDYVAPEFPAGYWPARDAETDLAGWQNSIDQFKRDLAALVAIVQDPKTDLYAQIPHGAAGHNILREVLIIAEHNAYHTGEIAILRQVLNIW